MRYNEGLIIYWLFLTDYHIAHMYHKSFICRFRPINSRSETSSDDQNQPTLCPGQLLQGISTLASENDSGQAQDGERKGKYGHLTKARGLTVLVS